MLPFLCKNLDYEPQSILIFNHIFSDFPDDVNEAYELIKDMEPTTPQEYILKAVVNASMGQEKNSVSSAADYCIFSCVISYVYTCNIGCFVLKAPVVIS